VISNQRSFIEGSLKGQNPFKNHLNPSPYSETLIKGSLRGAKPLLIKFLPLPLIKGKRIKGIGFPKRELEGVR